MPENMSLPFEGIIPQPARRLIYNNGLLQLSEHGKVIETMRVSRAVAVIVGSLAANLAAREDRVSYAFADEGKVWELAWDHE